MAVYSALLGCFEIFAMKGKQVISENTSMFEKVLRTFEKAVARMLKGAEAYLKRKTVVDNFEGACEVCVYYYLFLACAWLDVLHFRLNLNVGFFMLYVC